MIDTKCDENRFASRLEWDEADDLAMVRDDENDEEAVSEKSLYIDEVEVDDETLAE